MSKRMFIAFLLLLTLAVAVVTAEPGRRTIIYDEIATEVAASPAALSAANAANLWITLADLKRATRFELKPQGVCRDELCFPLPKARRTAFLTKQGKTDWFNLTEFAKLIRQPVAHDVENNAWYFGPRAEAQNGFVNSLSAPDFTLPDASGKPRSLREFRGKKVLLITWASW